MKATYKQTLVSLTMRPVSIMHGMCYEGHNEETPMRYSLYRIPIGYFLVIRHNNLQYDITSLNWV